MAIDIEFASKFIKDICISYIGGTFKSTLWTAILIVIVTLSIVVILYPKRKNASSSSYIKPVMYIFLSTLLLLFIHDSCVQDSNKLSREDKSAENVIEDITMFRGKDSPTGGVYEAVYGKTPDGENVDVKARSHQTIGGNSYVAVTPAEMQRMESINNNPLSNSSESRQSTNVSDDGKIVNISQET